MNILNMVLIMVQRERVAETIKTPFGEYIVITCVGSCDKPCNVILSVRPSVRASICLSVREIKI